MRIVIASDLHWPTINGVATFGRNLAHGLAARHHDVIVIAPSQNGPSYKQYDGNHWIYRTVSVQFPFYQNLRISVNPNVQVRHIIERFKPDVIHMQTPLGVGRAVLAASKRLDIPVVATNHGLPENLIENLRLLAPFARPISYILKEYGSRFYNNVDYITLPTQAAIDTLSDTLNNVSVPVKAVSNGIDLQRFHPGKAEAGFLQRFALPAHKPIALYAGRLDTEKHLSILVRAAAAVMAKRDVHLLIVGHGNDADNLKWLANDLGIARHVTFTGRVEDEDLPVFYRCAALFVMPSPAELQSLTTLEAMASGLPIVAVRAGALEELCHNGRNGYTCAADDSEGMAEKIEKILSASASDRVEMGKTSIAIARTHDLSHVIGQFENIYKQAIKLHAQRERLMS